jgi:hypothetical protein
VAGGTGFFGGLSVPGALRALEHGARRAMVVVKRWVRLMLVRSHAFSRLPIFRCTVVTMCPSLPIAILPGVVAELGCVF